MTRQHEGQLPRWLFLLLGLLFTLSPLHVPAAESPTLPEGLATPAQSTPMPTFELPDPAGNPVRSADLQGKVVIVRFWASW
jgi:cytochrome oxidase Cu insertion factor (SCO1/SenC/PrrC family)